MNYKYDLQKSKQLFIDKGYIPLFDEYINTKTKYLAKTKDGYKFEMNIDNIKNNKKANCFSNKNKFLKENIEMLIKNKGLNLTFIDSIFENSKLYIKVRCNIHGIEYITTKGDINRGRECVKCGREKTSNKQKNTLEGIKRQLKNKNKNLEIISNEYINNNEKLKVRCLKCEHTWDVSWANLQKYKVCPKCNGSIGEKIIIDYLNRCKIKYFFQYRFEECKNIRTLPFDFYLYELNTVIEYDGEFHYEPARYSDDKNKMIKKLECQKENDKLKDDFCKFKEINLIRIPYWEINNIENILNDSLQI